jgi:excisionase family DNA binding protein
MTTATYERPGTRYPVRQFDLTPRWLTVAQTAELLGYRLTKTKMLIISGDLRSIKDGHSRRILPEWIDDYIARRVAEYEEARRPASARTARVRSTPYKNGYDAYVWITTPAGRRQRSTSTARLGKTSKRSG